jgi:hypothetical protein
VRGRRKGWRKFGFSLVSLPFFYTYASADSFANVRLLVLALPRMYTGWYRTDVVVEF